MFMIEIGGTHILYTGDYSMQDDRHLMAAEIPEISPDVLIVESTYGVQVLFLSVFLSWSRYMIGLNAAS